MKFSRFLLEGLSKGKNGEIKTGWAIICPAIGSATAITSITLDELSGGAAELFISETEFNQYLARSYADILDIFADEIGGAEIHTLHSDPEISAKLKAKMIQKGHKDPLDMTYAELKKREHWHMVESQFFIFSTF